MKYLHWDQKIIADSSHHSVTEMYGHGYVFTRLGKGVMQQTRSVRIDLSRFKPSSENRRILRKGESISIEHSAIPYADYTWEIGKIAKDFYGKKFGGAFSANKIKELLTSDQNFNALLSFKEDGIAKGYAICYETQNMLHYSYPFYELEASPKDMGLIMMTKVLDESKERGLSYVYLGSLQRPTDTYKLQFEGLEWFDGERWVDDIEKVKVILSN